MALSENRVNTVTRYTHKCCNKSAVNLRCSHSKRYHLAFYPPMPHRNVGELPPSTCPPPFSAPFRRQAAAIAARAAAVPPAGIHNAGQLQQPQQRLRSPQRQRTIGPSCWVRIAPMGWCKETFETGKPQSSWDKKTPKFLAKIFRLNQYWET